MENFYNLFNDPNPLILFLQTHRDVMFNCITYDNSLKEIILTFPNGNHISIFSDGRKMFYNPFVNANLI